MSQIIQTHVTISAIFNCGDILGRHSLHFLDASVTYLWGEVGDVHTVV